MSHQPDLGHLRWVLERQLSWIKASDAKLAVLVPVPVAMLGLVFASLDKISSLSSWELFPFALSTGLLLTCLYRSAASLVPRVKGPYGSLVFFGRISEKKAEDYVEDAIGQTAECMAKDLAAQIHVNASIAAEKHKHICWSIYLLAAAIIPWLITVYMVG